MFSTQDQSVADFAIVCDLLSEKVRLQLVFLLAKGETNVSRLCKEMKVNQPLVSHHLGLLRMNGMAVATRKGKQVFYSLAKNCRVSGDKLKISLASSSVSVEEL